MSIANALADDIAGGVLKKGDLLPTQRDLANSLGTAIGTVTRAYAELEKRGLIHASGRKGTFVGSGTVRGTEMTSLIQPSLEKIDFSMVQPVFSHEPDLQKTLKELSSRIDTNNLLQYQGPEATDRHKQAGSEWIKKQGFSVAYDKIITTTGAQNALFAILATICDQREVVLVEELVYPGIKAIAEILHLKLYPVKMDSEGILPDALESACIKTHARVMFCTPDIQNPTTGVLSENRREEIVRIAMRFDLYLIEDSIHRPLLPTPPRLLSEFLPDHTFSIFSTSKTIGNGLRVAFVVCPDTIRPKIVFALQSLNLMVSLLPLELFATWIEDGTIDRTLKSKRKEAGERQKIAVDLLSGFNLRTNINGYFSWLILPENTNRSHFVIKAHRLGVNVATSDIFAVDEPDAPEAVRLAISTPHSPNIVKTGLEIILDILKEDAMKHSAFFG